MIKTIFWDFDGVILDSMPIRDYGFAKIFEEFDKNLVDKLLEYHTQNGGLSRYVKIMYFYNTLLEQEVSNEKVQELADKFSVIMQNELINKKYLIDETVDFIKKNYQNYNFHIVSGSDGKELNYLCKELELFKYFKTIEGSPTCKNDLVKDILEKYNYNPNESILIGDSINDYEAAKINNIDFYGFNNKELIDYSKTYIKNFYNILFLDYGIGENSTSKENKTFFKIEDSKEIDYLIFVDSRGFTINKENYQSSYIYKFTRKLENKNKSYIAVSRPKNLVTFGTLLNFLSLNSNFYFKNLITNVSFVDFTPKKEIFIKDMILQANILYDKFFDVELLSDYKTSEGENNLFSLKYPSEYINFIAKYISSHKFMNCIFINTPIISKNIQIKRKRPIEFFVKINESNSLLDKIVNSYGNFKLIDISNKFIINQENYTYDAVHYTLDGHRLILEDLLQGIEF